MKITKSKTAKIAGLTLLTAGLVAGTGVSAQAKSPYKFVKAPSVSVTVAAPLDDANPCNPASTDVHHSFTKIMSGETVLGEVHLYVDKDYRKCVAVKKLTNPTVGETVRVRVVTQTESQPNTVADKPVVTRTTNYVDSTDTKVWSAAFLPDANDEGSVFYGEPRGALIVDGEYKYDHAYRANKSANRCLTRGMELFHSASIKNGSTVLGSLDSYGNVYTGSECHVIKKYVDTTKPTALKITSGFESNWVKSSKTVRSHAKVYSAPWTSKFPYFSTNMTGSMTYKSKTHRVVYGS